MKLATKEDRRSEGACKDELLGRGEEINKSFSRFIVNRSLIRESIVVEGRKGNFTISS